MNPKVKMPSLKDKILGEGTEPEVKPATPEVKPATKVGKKSKKLGKKKNYE